MVRGGGFGGFGGGGQITDFLHAIAAMPMGDLLRVAVGLLLMALIIVQMTRVAPARPRATQRSSTCLICGRALDMGRAYVDRYFPNWVACRHCYEKLSPVKQRQYRAE